MDAKLSKFTANQNQKTSLLVWIEWGLLLSALACFTITEAYRAYVTIGLGLLVASIIVRGIRSGQILPATQLDLPAGLFIASAALATWIAYDQATALLQFARILAGAALFYAICDSTANVRRWLGAGFVLAAAFLAIYWPIQHDFIKDPVQFEIINQAGRWINSQAPEIDLRFLTGPSIHKNVASATLALALPFSLALVWDLWQRRHHIMAGLGGILAGLASLFVVIISAGIVITSARGIWLGIAGTIGLIGLAAIQRKWFNTRSRKIAFWGLITLLAIILALGLFTTGNLARLVGQIPDPTGTLQSRVQLWRQGIGLIQGHFFTGSGLMTFWMVHATYSLLIHTPYIAHVHNTFLEVWIEQGILGPIALVWGSIVVAWWAWRALDEEKLPAWGLAGFTGLTIIAIQSTIDVSFYVERTLPLIGLALGFTWLLTKPQIPLQREKALAWRLAALAIIIVLITATIILRQPIISAWHANLGALSQAKTELRIYDPVKFDNPTMDQIRQGVDLSKATSAFQQSLDWRPDNPTALQRLSLIALSHGEFESALSYMQTAWDSDHRDDVTRLLYGDALVAHGQTTQAAGIVRGLAWAENRLMFQAWYRYWLNQDYQRAAYAWETTLLLNPNNQAARDFLEEAQERMEP